MYHLAFTISFALTAPVRRPLRGQFYGWGTYCFASAAEDGRGGPFNRIDGPDMLPKLSWEIITGQKHVVVLDQFGNETCLLHTIDRREVDKFGFLRTSPRLYLSTSRDTPLGNLFLVIRCQTCRCACLAVKTHQRGDLPTSAKFLQRYVFRYIVFNGYLEHTG